MIARAAMYQDELKNYKFYLSFENALCEDYITEKFFLAAYAGALPVVYGSPQISDYEKVAPPHSFISVAGHKDVKELAKHLESLAVDEVAYNSYFWWNNHYDVITNYQSQYDAHCSLCYNINKIMADGQTDVGSEKYKVFRKYWYRDGVCQKSILV